MGIKDLNRFDYQRDHLSFDYAVRYTVSLDVDGVWIKAQLPWDFENEYGFKQTAYLSETLRADVEFDRDALALVVKRIDDRLFFPEHTVLGQLQRKYRKNKKDSMAFLARILKEKRDSHLICDDIYEDPLVQRAIARRLKRVLNIDAGIFTVRKELFARLVALGRQSSLKRLSKLDVSDLMTDFDGDIDELEAEFYSRFEQDAIYV